MRFLMRNFLKYMHSNAKMEFLRKRVGPTVPYSVMWISPRYFVHIGSMGNPLTADAEIHGLLPFYFN